MEKAHAKSALKFVKAGSQSAVTWSSTASKLAKDNELNKSKVSPKVASAKDNTKPLEFTLHTQQRAVKRAMFNYSVATKLYLMEIHKKRVEKLQKMLEEEEVRLMRKEMVPRAQLMPLFDRPFFPQRSSRPLTVPREPSMGMVNGKSCNISGNHELQFWKLSC
ncbi:protein TPX2 [Mangifera indica]|uniref:protein TPX2 n=1 Tax=Mangifera indica TaxID=29780 RepID=UPI001CFB8919|nr:protein TPX2 [Mangifera indica]